MSNLFFSEKKFPNPPLKNLQFFMYGKFKCDKEDIKKRILKMGGLITSKVTDTLAAVVSTEKEVKKMPSKMETIQAEDIEVSTSGLNSCSFKLLTFFYISQLNSNCNDSKGECKITVSEYML